jgi:hypothetical protein
VYPLQFGYTPPPSGGIGIISLRVKREIILELQRVTGKIQSLKELVAHPCLSKSFYLNLKHPLAGAAASRPRK